MYETIQEHWRTMLAFGLVAICLGWLLHYTLENKESE